MRQWDELSMKEKAAYIKLGVRNGITDISTIRDVYHKYSNGGELSSNNKPYRKTNLWDYITSAGKTPIGVREYNTEVPFKEAFRTSRNDGLKTFYWNNKKYNTELAPDEFAESWKDKKPSTLRDIAARKLVIRNPDKFRNHTNKDIDKLLQKDPYLNVIPYHKNINYTEVNKVVKGLKKVGLSKHQIAGMLGNSLGESGWRNIDQINGSAKGYFQMEPTERALYEDYLKKNNIKTSFENEAVYIAKKFIKKDKALKTPHDRATEASRGKAINYEVYKTAGLPEYKGITTKDAFASWNDGTVDGATEGFMQLFERAGKPHLERRKFLSNILLEDPNIKW